MKTDKTYSEMAPGVDVDALLAAISDIVQDEVHYPPAVDNPEQVSVDGRNVGSWNELADAFELDIHDFSVSEVNR